MAGDITKQVVAGVIVALLSAAGSAIYAKFSPPEPKEGIQKIIYVVGSEINRSLGITVQPALVQQQQTETAQPAPQQAAAQPTPPVSPPAVTQDTPFQSGSIYVSEFKAARKNRDVLFSFSVRNTSQQTIFIALDHNEGIAVSAESGRDSAGSATGIKSVYFGEEKEKYYTELGAGSILYVTANLYASKLPDPTANFNITLLQLAEGKTIRYTFGRPVAITVKEST